MLAALVGQPNSGKSALLHKMTGARVLTSNYPGTTVELVSGRLRVGKAGNAWKRGSQGQRPEDILVLDTPGIYSLSALTKEQEVTRGIVNDSGTDLIVNVLDGSNLWRHLSLTLALLRTGVPVIVAVNCADRMRDLGMDLDAKKLEAALGAPVVLTSAVTGEGVEQLTGMIAAAAGRSGGNIYPRVPTSGPSPRSVPVGGPNIERFGTAKAGGAFRTGRARPGSAAMDLPFPGRFTFADMEVHVVGVAVG